MTEKVTYDSLLRDDKFLNDAWNALNAQGINVSDNRKDILDRFLTNKRYFDTNIASTFVIGDNVKDMSEANKQSYANAVTKIEQLPSIGKAGAAPTSSLIKDYLVAGVTDPTNLISILAGAFTFGTGTAAVQAGKETAKAGVKKLLKAKVNALTKNQQRKALAKTLLAEGTIAGAGGGLQAYKSQDVDMAIGRRQQGDYDLGKIGQQALIEGIASPVAGIALAGIGKAGIKGVKGVGNIARNTKAGEASAQYINRMKNYLLPFGGVDEITQRNFEGSRAIFKTIKADTEKIIDDIKINEDRFIKDDPIKRDLVNDAMEGNTAQLQKLQEEDAGMYNAVKSFVDLRKRVYEKVFKYTDPQSEKIQKIYHIDPKNYMKRIHARSQNRGMKMPFKFWKKYEVNADLVKQMTDKIKVDKNLQVQFGIRDGVIDPVTKKVESTGELKKNFKPLREGKIDIGEQNTRIERFVERRIYDIDKPKNQETTLGALKKRKDIDPILQEIWGVNYSPAVRAASTIEAIVEPVSDVLVADQIGRSLKGRGIGIQAESLADAITKATDLGRPDAQDLVPLVGARGDKDVGIELKRNDLFNPELGQLFVPRNIAQKLRVLTDSKPVFGSSFLGSLFSGANGYLKKGVTVYNPFGHIRNALGVPQYVAASGNLQAIPKLAQKVLTDKKGFQEFKLMADRLGVTATNVEIGQILGRLADARKIETEDGVAGYLGRRFLDFASGGMSSVERTRAGKKFGRAAERAYTGTDDVGKLMTLLSERGKAQDIWKGMTEFDRKLKRRLYADNFGKNLPDVSFLSKTQAKKVLDKFDDDLLMEEAAGKTLNIIPVYDRVPKILEKMRDVPIIGAFTAFPAENLRNKYNILKLGAEELREGFETGNKGLIRAGGRRLRQQIMMAAAPTVAAYTYNEVMGTDKVEPGIRKTQPEWAKYHALQIRPKGKDKEGNETYGVTDLSYNNPDQYVLDIITPLMMAAASGEDVVEKLDELFPYAVKKAYEPFLGLSMATELGLSFLDYAKADTDTGAIKAITNSYKLVEPGMLKLLRDIGGEAAAEDAFNILSSPLGKGELGTRIRNSLNPSYFGDTAKLSKSFTELGALPTGFESPLAVAMYPFRLGLKEQDYKPKKQIGFAVSNLMRNANGTLNAVSGDIKDRLSNPNNNKNIKLKNIMQDYNEAIEEQFAAQQGVFEMINDLKGFMTDAQIRKILQDKKIKSAGGFSNKEINNLMRGKFTVPVFNKQGLRDAAKNNPAISKYLNNIQDTFLALERAYEDSNLQTEELPDISIGD